MNRTHHAFVLLFAIFAVPCINLCATQVVHGQEPGNETAKGESGAPAAGKTEQAKTGDLLTLPLPLDNLSAQQLSRALDDAVVRGGDQQRRIVVIQWGEYGLDNADVVTEGSDGRVTQLEDALRVSRLFGRPEYRTLKIVAYLPSSVRGHAVLPLMTADQIVVSGNASIGDATSEEIQTDETIASLYQASAKRRGLFHPAVVDALTNQQLELISVIDIEGKQQFVAGDAISEIRDSGRVVSEDSLAAAGRPLELNADQLRELRIASHVADDMDSITAALDLAELRRPELSMPDDVGKGVLIEINGELTPGRFKRIQTNLSGATQADAINSVLLSIDSPGGNLNGSLSMAGTLAARKNGLRVAAGWVSGQALSDAALVAVACRPLHLHPDATMGGPGAMVFDEEQFLDVRDAIDDLAIRSRRPAALLRALVDPSIAVYRYRNQRTGRIRYATEDQLNGEGNGGLQWKQEERIDFTEGIDAQQAIELGLAESLSEELSEVADGIGFEEVPQRLAERPIIRFVERIGQSVWLPILLILVGVMTLSIEMNAPGLGVPGFISVVCFTLFFWMAFLQGTAEWLEITAFIVGLLCIGLEIFVIPGFGIFGIGGMGLLVLSIVLAGQTFVIPQNPYQLAQMSRNLWMIVGGAVGLIAGLVVLRTVLPRTPMMRHLMMDAPDESIEETERVASMDELVGQTGAATTPLMPGGKARFGDRLVSVVSEGDAIPSGAEIQVIDVQGNRVIVQAVDGVA
ncbi:MAG: NfeD family protein [Planctomycetota bacterium]